MLVDEEEGEEVDEGVVGNDGEDGVLVDDDECAALKKGGEVFIRGGPTPLPRPLRLN